jgi:lysophospholipase
VCAVSSVPQNIEYRDFNELPRSLGSRATDQSPKGYAPSTVDCPSERPVVRLGSELSPQEKEWLPRRRNETIAPIRALLDRIAIPGFNSDRYLSNVEKDPTALPNIGLAVSGGGYRALQNGAGAIAAWDARSTDANSTGKLGGLLQSATYISGLSGGGWLVGSIYTNNFSTIQGIIDAGAWQFDESILAGRSRIETR